MSKSTLKTASDTRLQVVELDQLAKSAPAGADLDHLGRRAREELEQIVQLEEQYNTAEAKLVEYRAQTALRAVYLGVVLHQVKAELGHGKFGRWRADHLGGLKERQARYYMQLAAIFVREEGVFLPEVLALPQTTLDLKGGTKDAQSALKKARHFVGNRSLNELLVLHGLKVRGGYHPSEAAVQKWLADTHPKQAGKTYAELSEDQQLAYQQSGYNDRDWRTPAEILKEDTEAAHNALRSPIVSLGEELDRPEWRQFVSPPDLVALRREAMDVVAKIDQRIAEMEGRA